VRVDGKLGAGVTPKDVILAIIAKIGAGGAVGHVIEYAGGAFAAMSIEGRLTVCNMSIEAGARAGLVAPDATTFAYLTGRPFAPKGADWDKAYEYFDHAWGAVVLPRLRQRFEKGPLDWSAPPPSLAPVAATLRVSLRPD